MTIHSEPWSQAVRAASGGADEPTSHRRTSAPDNLTAPIPHGRFLMALPEDVRSSLIDQSQRVQLRARTLLSSGGQQLEHCYFIEQGVLSCILRLADGFEGASAIIGPEGLVGFHAVAGAGSVAPHDTLVQLSGSALQVPATVLREAIRESSPLVARLLRFNEAVRLQMAQSAVCNLRHPLPQRLARWLLMAYNRVGGSELRLTQEALSAMLGASRASVTHAARQLRDAGAIDYRYGLIVLRDRARLEEMSCECYAIVRAHYRRLLDQD